MKDSVIKNKTYLFALEIIKVCRDIANNEKEFVLSRQLLKSGTSIGALVREGEHAQSTADFISKMSIALKEANETDYWLLLLRDSKLIDSQKADQLITDNNELIRMLISTVKTTKAKLNT